MGMHEEQTPKTNTIRENYVAMTPIEPIPNPHNIPDSAIPAHLRSASPIGHGEHFTVVYFMPDGDAIIRYEKVVEALSRPNRPGANFLADQAFAVIRVFPSVNGSGGGIEFLKFKGDIKEAMQSMTNAFLKPSQPNTPPKTFPIND